MSNLTDSQKETESSKAEVRFLPPSSDTDHYYRQQVLCALMVECDPAKPACRGTDLICFILLFYFYTPCNTAEEDVQVSPCPSICRGKLSGKYTLTVSKLHFPMFYTFL